MKKLLSLFIITLLCCSMLSWGGFFVQAYEQGEELLPNPGFENGDISMWDANGCTISRDSAVKKSGSYGIKAVNRQYWYSSPRQNITDILTQCGSGSYTFSAWMRLAEGETAGQMYVVISIQDANSQMHWYTGSKVNVTSSGFVQSKITDQDISWEGTLRQAYIYVQNVNSEETPDVYADDFSLVKTSGITETSGYIATPQTADKRGTGDPAVGAIRWDAWLPKTQATFGSNSANNVGAQVARSLGPAKYHFRLPYFAIYSDNKDGDPDNDVDFPSVTQAIMDNEIRYAEYAGIDYWAYCWYPIGSGLDSARNRHVSSSLRDKVKMCAILNVNPFGAAERAQLVDYMSQSFYMKVQNGRPLLFFFNNSGALATIVDIQLDCLAKGIPMPYCVSMEGMATGMDAVSRYAYGGSNGQSFASLAQATENNWNSQKSGGSQVLPLVNTGWDTRPRYDHPVTWTTVSATSWAQTATAAEIKQHLQNGLNWTKNNTGYTFANAVLMYAWNEHDEGGWLCPTVKVDANGNILKQANGLNQVNTDRVDALHSLFGSAAPTVNPYATAAPTVAPTVKPTPAPTYPPVTAAATPSPKPSKTPKVTNEKMTATPKPEKTTAQPASSGANTAKPTATFGPSGSPIVENASANSNNTLPLAAGAGILLLCAGMGAYALLHNKKK